MKKALRETRIWQDVDVQLFREEILPLGEPAVLKGLVAHWPAVQAAAQSAVALARYVAGFAGAGSASAIVAPPAAKGRFFYSEDLKSFNFSKRDYPIRDILATLMAEAGSAEPPAIAIQHLPLAKGLPGFERHNTITLAGAGARSGAWIGNRAVVATHFDLDDNLACVVGGHRRFTLFPPDQVRNLYIGPIELTPAGMPISLVDLDAPDPERFPRFEQALAAAQVAELEPGDAIYIPYLWWHHVRSLDPFNMLVNYWWNEAPSDVVSPFELLMLGFISARDVPPRYRDAWKSLFDHWVFRTDGDPAAHMPEGQGGVLQATTQAFRRYIKASLARSLGGG